MKKIVLLSAIIGFAFSTIAQNQMVSRKNQKRVKDTQEMAVERTQKVPTPEFKQSEAVNDVSRVYVGTAGHQRGVHREEAHIVSYNYDLDIISITSILDPATYPDVNGNSTVGMWYSANQGQNWSGPVIINDNAHYYLSGALYSPVGNTVVENMFGVHQGTDYLVSEYLYFGSSTLGGGYQANYIFEIPNYNGFLNIFGLNQFDKEMRCLNLMTNGTWGGITEATLQPIVGEFNDEGFDWDLSSFVEANLFVDSDEDVSWIGLYAGMDSGTEIAWSDDGVIGYMWMVGVSNENTTGYQPVVFRTDDAGESWEYIYLDFFIAEMQSILEPYLYECSSGLLIPHVFESAGVVDVHGDLQMMLAMGSTTADVIIYPDSIGYHWEYPGDLFNIVVDEDGISDLLWVDSLRTENVLPGTPGAYCETAGWNHRISAAKSESEKQLFFTWTETRNINETFNLKPDLFGWSKTVYGASMESTVCLTEGSELEEFFHFNYGSDKAYYNSVGATFTIPYLQAVSPLEYFFNMSLMDPFTLSYITGIEFPDLLIGVKEFESTNRINVTQNVPNPFTSSTTIEVSTETAALVIVEVSNIIGQNMYTHNSGIINGTQEIELSAKNLEAGIYFYTVRIGNESITKKMIVK